MTEERTAFRWIRAVAGMAFVAGIVVGLAIPVVVEAVRPPAPIEDPNESFVQSMATKYELSPDQVRTLRMILHDDNAAATRIIKEIIRAKPEDLPPELHKVRNRTDERIQVMLTAEQREQYKRDTTRNRGK